ncbi:hypothetical protein T11_626 [Trichinella zimbabwensis]|uniref:Uncharacterized protein n=1 Tax=Trichinella zimbabwensis TaxID=268475 RepID=A0A0V1G7H9_9BILA|nr:hypothetical protein T11_626 [Trichinella zimbabwensis]
MKFRKKEDQSVGTLILLRRYHPDTAPPGDLSHKQPPMPDTMADSNKWLLTGDWYNCPLSGSASA